MKTKNFLVVWVGIGALLAAVQSSFAQGGLTPPGAPAATMKTLMQVEPRTDVLTLSGNANNQYLITQSGSYYLTTNIVGAASKNGISIQADNVTLDLNGFTLFGVASSQQGILVSGPHVGTVIHHGTISGWGANGISAGNAGDSEFDHLRLTTNSNVGLKVGSRNTITGCLAVGNAGDGIDAGANCSLVDCRAANNQAGVATGSGCCLRGCTANNNAFSGITTGDNCLLTDSVMVGNSLSGISAGAGCSLFGGTAASNSAPTIATGSGCTIKDFSVVASGDTGIQTGDKSSVINCTASGGGFHGISVGMNCSVLGCGTTANFADGISTGEGCTIKDCTANANFQGILTGNGCTLSSCTANGNTNAGFYLSTECSISGCTARQNSSIGIYVNFSCLVKDNVCASNNRYGTNILGGGIIANSEGNRIEGNVSNNDQNGIAVFGVENIIIHNTVRSSITANYSIFSGNMVGVIVAAPVSGGVNGNTGGTGLGTTDPWANFSY